MSFRRSLKYAKRGVMISIKRERNFRIHLVIAALVFLCALLGQVEAWAWISLILTCSLVIVAELLNTAMETICNKVQPQIDPLIRDIKDISAGAVLFSAAFAIIIACVVFLRPEILAKLAGHLFELGVLVLLTPVLLYVVSKMKL